MEKNVSLFGLLVVVAAMTSGVAEAKRIDPTVLNDGSTLMLMHPSAKRGPNGRIHVVMQGRPAATPSDSNTTNIYYMLLSSSGNVLIDATPIGAAAHQQSPPSIAVLPDNRAVVVKKRSGTDPIRYMLVDPSGDDLDGSAATPGNILDVAETSVGVLTSSGHQTVVVDDAGIAHVVWAASDNNLYHLAFNPGTSAIVVPEHDFGNVYRRRTPGLDVDSQGNLHVVATSTTLDGNGPAAYWMLENDGTVAIDATQLYDDEAIFPKASHFSLFVDNDDIVHILYGDKRHTVDAETDCDWCYTGGTAVYTRLDPSADDQDGDAAVIADIRVGNERELGNFWYSIGFQDGKAFNFFSSGNGNHGRGNITYRKVSAGSASEPRVIEASIGGFTYSKHYVASAGNLVIWSNEDYSPTITGVTTRLVMANLGAFSGGGGGGGAPAPIMLLILGLAGLARFATRR